MFDTIRKCALLLAVAVTGVAMAQSTLERPVGEFVNYKLDSGDVQNLERGPVVVYHETVFVENAASMRLYFDQLDLDGNSYVRMTSEFDGEVQELDSYDAAMWNYASAYFNGDTVQLELVAAPGSSTNRVVLGSVAVEFYPTLRGPCADDDCGMCNGDDRVLSYENWAGRLMPVGCTGSVYNTDSCVVTAGHCADGGWANTIQFNVPLSFSSCATRNPPVADQFPITGYLFNNNGPGDDWAVLTTGTNSLGQQPYERYGLIRPISSTVASTGSSAAVWGYGADNDNTTRNAVQQTDSGSVVGRTTRIYYHNVDITYGNSGSALIHNDEIIGIVTHCSFNCTNVATRIDVSDFTSARENLCGLDCDVVFNTQPTPSQTVCEGDFVQLSIDVDNPALMDFQWQRGGVDLVDDGSHIGGATTETLTIVDFTAADSANDYQCIVTNTAQSCSANSSFAEVLADTNLPAITQQPVSQVVTEGGFASFSIALETTFFVEYQWYKGAAALTNDGHYFGVDNDMLTIVPVVLGDAGDYHCVITSQLGELCSKASDSATLTVDPAGNDCPEDLDGSGAVDLADLAALLANYGITSGAQPEDGDFDGDGDVDLADLAHLLSVYGQDCPTQ